MGRYAEFNTWFTYKFAFGAQSSGDITLFGGWCVRFKDDEDCGSWAWDQTDKPHIQNKLADYQKSLFSVDYDTYEKSLSGTVKLHDDLREKIPNDHTYILGCLLYHQLLYSDTLIAHFEF